jgi:hypothetical protein
MKLTILECFLHRAWSARLVSVLVCLEALAAKAVSKILEESEVGLTDVEIAILDCDVARDFIEEQVMMRLALAQELLGILNVGDVGRHLHYGGNLTGLITNRRCVDDYGKINAAIGANLFFAFMTLPIAKSSSHWAHFAPICASLVNLIAIAAFKVTEVLPEVLVGIDYPKVRVLDRQITRHFFEILLKRRAHFVESPALAM